MFATPTDPAWDALVAARDELRQTLADKGLVGAVLSLSTGELAPINPEAWRVDGGFEAFTSGRFGKGAVLLDEAEFNRWMAASAPSLATEPDSTTDDESKVQKACSNSAAATGAPASLSDDENVADDASAKPSVDTSEQVGSGPAAPLPEPKPGASADLPTASTISDVATLKALADAYAEEHPTWGQRRLFESWNEKGKNPRRHQRPHIGFNTFRKLPGVGRPRSS